MSEERVSLSNPQVALVESVYVPPTEAVPLPSLGKVYSPGHALCNKDRVEVRSMTARDEDILTSKALMKQGKAISTLLRNCLIDHSIDPDQLLVGDKNALLIAIRVTGYGPEYRAKVECPECSEKVDVDFDLNSLPIIPLGAEPLRPNENIFGYKLMTLKKDVTFRLMTGDLERQVVEVMTQSKKRAGPLAVDTVVTTRLMHQITSIGGETDPGKLAKIISNLPARDSRDLRGYMDKISPGIDMKHQFSCPNVDCGQVSEVAIPLGVEFFWPS